MPFGIQPIHLIVVLIAALIIFGPSRLPEIGRGLGKAITEFKRGTHEMTESFREEISVGMEEKTSGSPLVKTEAAAGNFCTNCGASNPSGARFCNKCGSSLST